MKSTARKILLSLLAAIMAVCFAAVPVFYGGAAAFAEIQAATVNFENDETGKVYSNYTVEESDGNKYLKSNGSGFGTTGVLYANDANEECKNFIISADFMFPAGSSGIVWIFVNGISEANDFQMMDVHFENGVTHVYAQDGASLGNIADTSEKGVQVAADTWHTMKVDKAGSLYTLYIDDVSVLEYIYANTDKVPAAIQLMQFLGNGVVCFDNFKFEPYDPEIVELEGLSLSAPEFGYIGIAENIAAVLTPADANNFNGVEWYVKAPGADNYEKQQADAQAFALTATLEGEYSVYAKIGEIESQPVSVSFLPVPDEITVDFEDDEEGKAFGSFVIGQADGNKYLTSPATGFGQSGNLYNGLLGDKINENVEISADFMFPNGTEGILWIFVNGMTAKNDFQMMDVHFSGGVTHVYAQDGDSLGDIADTSSKGVQVAADTWHTMKVIKESALYKLYIDDVEVLSYRYAGTNNVPAAITLMQYLTKGSGACFDNFKVKKHEVQVIPVESLAITSVSAKVSQGASVAFTAEVSPANANTFTEIEWYVKAPGASDYEIQDETGVTFYLPAALVGEYYVYAKIGDKTSNSKYVTVTEKKEFAFVDTSLWGTYIKQDFDDADIWDEGIGWGGPNNDTFKSNGKGQMKYVEGEPIQVGIAWYGESFPLSYEIKIDVNIAEGSHGTFWFCLENFFGGETGKWTSVGINFTGDEWFAYLTSDTYGEMMTSSDVDVKALCGYGKWFTLKMYKHNDGFALYVDDAIIMQYEADATKTLDTGIIWLNILSIMTGANDTLLLDNFEIRTDVGESPQQLSVMIAPPASKTITVGESVMLEGKFYPSASSVESVEWYLNGTKLDCSSLKYTFAPDSAGTYEFKIVVNGEESEILTMTVNAPATESDSGCNGSLNAAFGLTLIPVLAVYVFIRKKHRR